MKAVHDLRPTQPSIVEERLSSFKKVTTKNTNYYNFSPEPNNFVEYSYDYSAIGRFVVNIENVDHLGKGVCYDTWDSFI
jgi:hypothetical protein